MRPPPSVRLPRAVREDHFAWFRMFHIPGKCDVDLGARGIPDFEVVRDLRDVEYSDGNGEGQRDRIAQVDHRMNVRERAFFPESPQERVRGASILRRLEAHL